MCIYICIYIYTFREVVSLGSLNTVIMVLYGQLFGGLNKAINTREWSICGCGRLKRSYCTYTHVYTYSQEYSCYNYT